MGDASHTITHKPLPAISGMFAAATIWGTWVIILAQWTLPGIFVTPITSLTSALGLGTLVLLSSSVGPLLVVLRDRAFTRLVAQTALLEVIQNTLFIVSFSLAIRDGGSVVIPIIRSFAGVITPLLATLAITEKFSSKYLLYGSLSTIGAVIIFTRGGIELGQNLSYLALGMVTLSVFIRGWFYIRQRAVAWEMSVRGHAALHVLTLHTVFSALLLSPILVGFGFFAAQAPVPNIPEQVLFLGFFGLTHMAFAPLLRLRSMRYLNAQQTIIIMYIEPMTSVLLSIVFLGEAVTVSFFIGAALILASAAAASLQAQSNG